MRCDASRVLPMLVLSIALVACAEGAGDPTPMFQDLAATAPPSTPADQRGNAASPSSGATAAADESGSPQAVGPLVLSPTPDRLHPPTPTRTRPTTPIPVPLSSTTPDLSFVLPTIEPTPTPGGIPDGSLTLTGTLVVSGDEQESRAFVGDPDGDMPDQPFASCEQYAQGVVDGDRRFTWVPNPVSGWEPVIFDPVDLYLRVQPYAGPGVYDQTTGVSGWTTEEIERANQDEIGLVYLPSIQIEATIYTDLSADSSVEVEIQPDGSGRLTFTNLHSNAAIDAEFGWTPKTISGQMDWTCAIHREP